MNLLNKAELKLLSFPDTQLTEFIFDDLQERKLSLKCTHAYVGNALAGYEITHVRMNILSFNHAVITKFKDDQLSVISNYTPDLALKDICEFILSDKEVFLKGFSTSGYWIEYCFENAQIEVFYK